MSGLNDGITLKDAAGTPLSDYRLIWWVHSGPFSNWGTQLWLLVTEVIAGPALFFLEYTMQMVEWLINPRNVTGFVSTVLRAIFDHIVLVVPFYSLILGAYGLYIMRLIHEISQARSFALTDRQSQRLTVNSIVTTVGATVFANPIGITAAVLLIEEHIMAVFSGVKSVGAEFSVILRILIWQINFRNTIPAQCVSAWNYVIHTGNDPNNRFYSCLPAAIRAGAISPNWVNMVSAIILGLFAIILVFFFLAGVTCYYSNFTSATWHTFALGLSLPKAIIQDVGYAALQDRAEKIGMSNGRMILAVLLFTLAPAALFGNVGKLRDNQNLPGGGSIFFELPVLLLALVGITVVFWFLMPGSTRSKIVKLGLRIPLVKKLLSASKDTTEAAGTAGETAATPAADGILRIDPPEGDTSMEHASGPDDPLPLPPSLAVSHTPDAINDAERKMLFTSASIHDTDTDPATDRAIGAVGRTDQLQTLGQNTATEVLQLIESNQWGEHLDSQSRTDIINEFTALNTPGIPPDVEAKFESHFAAWKEVDDLPDLGSTEWIDRQISAMEKESFDQGLAGVESPFILDIPYGADIVDFVRTPAGGYTAEFRL